MSTYPYKFHRYWHRTLDFWFGDKDLHYLAHSKYHEHHVTISLLCLQWFCISGEEPQA